jgi:hypothetical protein
MQECDLSQSLARIGDVLDLFSGSAERVFDAAIEDRVEYVFFAFEVEIDGAVCNARFASDVGDFRIEVAVVRKHTYRRAQDCFAFIADGGANSCQ